MINFHTENYEHHLNKATEFIGKTFMADHYKYEKNNCIFFSFKTFFFQKENFETVIRKKNETVKI